MNQRPKIRSATLADAERAVTTLARAFDADPPMNWVIRKDAGRAAGFREMFEVTFHTMTFPFGCVEVDEDGGGVALWTPPGKWQLGVFKQLGLLPNFVRVIGVGRLIKVVGAINRLQALHPTEPHYYLFALGVDPERQGRGIGAALLANMLARADAEQMPAYLEASTPMNRRLYERHGFVLRQEFLMAADAPPISLMWRDARPAAATGK